MTESGVCPNCNPGANIQASAASAFPPQSHFQGYPPQPPQQQQYPPQQGYPPQPPQQQQYPPQQGYPPTYVYVQTAPSPLAIDLAASFKQFFSADPQNALNTAISSKAHLWAILGTANILFIALTILLIPSGFLGGLYGMGGAFFGYGFLIALISFFALTGGVKVIFTANKINISFVSVLNIVSVSLMISSLGYVAAILFSFFFPTASLLFVYIGIFGSIAMLYVGIQKAAQFAKSPFWLFVVTYAVNMIIIFLIVYLIIMSLISRAAATYRVFSNLVNSLW